MNRETSVATLNVLSAIAGRVVREINGTKAVNDTEATKFDLERRIAQRILDTKELEGVNHVVK